jgi:hypothetical protein
VLVLKTNTVAEQTLMWQTILGIGVREREMKM